jgi:hypothetical protein
VKCKQSLKSYFRYGDFDEGIARYLVLIEVRVKGRSLSRNRNIGDSDGH